MTEQNKYSTTPRDYTHVGPVPRTIATGKALGKVDPTSQTLARDIRNFAWAEDTQESIARFIEWCSILYNFTSDHNEYIDFSVGQMNTMFSDVLKEFSEDKDYYSLPEISGARGGFGTLGDRLDNEVFDMSRMGQDVKESMTGGSVAVVGTDAVNTVNILDGAVTKSKMADYFFDNFGGKRVRTTTNAPYKNGANIMVVYDMGDGQNLLGSTMEASCDFIPDSGPDYIGTAIRFFVSDSLSSIGTEFSQNVSYPKHKYEVNKLSITATNGSVSGRYLNVLIWNEMVTRNESPSDFYFRNLSVKVDGQTKTAISYSTLESTANIEDVEYLPFSVATKAELAEFDGKADKVVLNNLVDAGDGTKGLSGWNSNNSSNVLEDDYLTNIGDGTLQYPQVWRNIIFNAGEKYYVSFRYKTTSSQIVVSTGTFGAGRVGESPVESSETWYTYSSYFEPHNRSTVMRMYHTYSNADSANGGKLSINDVIVVNLTETFGAGNEPTKEEIDELIKFTVYIDGGYALNNKEMLRYLTNSNGELKPNEFAPKYVYTPDVISDIDGQAPHPTSNQIYSNNVRMVENSILTGIKVQIKTSEIGDYYFNLYVIEPNARIVSKTRVDYSATVVGNETVTISGLDINVPKGAVVATETPQGAKSVIRYYSDSSLGSIHTYTSAGNEISKISGKVAHELYVNVKIELAEIIMENLTEKDHILKGKTWSVVGDSISDNINYGRLTLYYEWISEMVGGVQIDMQARAATGFIEESSSQGTENIMDRIPLLNPLSDYITVFAGTNDINRPLGTLGSTDVTTLYGSIDFVCKALIEKYPLKKIGFFTPIPRVGYASPNNKLEKVARAIKEVCALYSIPVLDLYTESGLRPNNVINKQTFFDNNDGLHPNSEGHKWLVPRILDFMEKL